MRNEHQFSALDRHAVLGGSDDGFPWFATQMLAMEASEVVRLRMEKFAHGDGDYEHEAQLMVTEKIFAAFEAARQCGSGRFTQVIPLRNRPLTSRDRALDVGPPTEAFADATAQSWLLIVDPSPTLITAPSGP